MGKENIFIAIIINMKDNGRMIRNMDMESIFIKIKERNMKGNLKMDLRMDLALSIIQMEIDIKELFIMGINMEVAQRNIKMEIV